MGRSNLFIATRTIDPSDIYIETSSDDDFELGDFENSVQIIYINGADEYFFLEGEKEIHHMEYGSNVVGWSNDICKESSLKGSITYPAMKEE